MNWDVILWLILLVVFLILEASTVTLVSIWFAAGSLAALAVCLLNGTWGLQIAVALAVAILLLIALRPMVRKYFTPRLVKTNVDSVIGSTGLVTIAVNNVKAEGQVKLGAMVWTARSTAGDPIPVGTQVQVDRIEGVKVFVTPVDILEKV